MRFVFRTSASLAIALALVACKQQEAPKIAGTVQDDDNGSSRAAQAYVNRNSENIERAEIESCDGDEDNCPALDLQIGEILKGVDERKDNRLYADISRQTKWKFTIELEGGEQADESDSGVRSLEDREFIIGFYDRPETLEESDVSWGIEGNKIVVEVDVDLDLEQIADDKDELKDKMKIVVRWMDLCEYYVETEIEDFDCDAISSTTIDDAEETLYINYRLFDRKFEQRQRQADQDRRRAEQDQRQAAADVIQDAQGGDDGLLGPNPLERVTCIGSSVIDTAQDQDANPFDFLGGIVGAIGGDC